MNEKDTHQPDETRQKKDSVEEVPIELRPLVKAISELPPDIRKKLGRVLDGTIERASRRRRAQSLQVEHLKARLKAALEQLAALQEKPEDETQEN